MHPIIFYLSHIILRVTMRTYSFLKIGTTGMCDDLTHGKVVVSGPEFNMI